MLNPIGASLSMEMSHTATALTLDANELAPIELLEDNAVESTNLTGCNSPAGDSVVAWSPFDLDLDIDVDPLYDIFPTLNKQGDPTLAELNSMGKSLLDDLGLDELPLPEETSSPIRGWSVVGTPQETQDVPSTPVNSSNVPIAANTHLRNLTLQQLLLGTTAPVAAQQQQQHVPSVFPVEEKQSVPCLVTVKQEVGHVPLSPVQAQQLDVPKMVIKQEVTESMTCSASPVHVPEESKVDVRKDFKDGHLAASVPDTSADIVSSWGDADSHDEGFDSNPEDSDNYNDGFSDAESDDSEDLDDLTRSCSPAAKSRKKERYFWQYNLQSKGPKGRRMPLQSNVLDPHQLNEITDPVFSPICQVQGIKHSGKARRGDGNDLTPHPLKLFHIGQELRKLNKVIDDLVPVSEMPFNARPKSRKEKNKLASRACRLKKKAQHEANKLKLYGLEQEHKRLLHTVAEARKVMIGRAKGNTSVEMTEVMDSLNRNCLKVKVAGNTVGFVNNVLAEVASGNISGNLEQIWKM